MHRQREAARLLQAVDDAVERLALEVLHRDEVALAVLPDLVGLDDVGVAEARGEPRLVEEHAEELRVLRELGPDLLDDHQLVEARRAPHDGEVDLGHAAVPELRDEPVLPEAVGPGARGRNLASLHTRSSPCSELRHADADHQDAAGPAFRLSAGADGLNGNGANGRAQSFILTIRTWTARRGVPCGSRCAGVPASGRLRDPEAAWKPALCSDSPSPAPRRAIRCRSSASDSTEVGYGGTSDLVARFFSPVPRGILPLLPIAPAIVVLVGITTALVIAVLGISQLQQTADDEARLEARAISATVAARLGAASDRERSEILKRSSQRREGSRPLPAVELLLVRSTGTDLDDGTSFKLPAQDDVLRLLGRRRRRDAHRARPGALRRARPSTRETLPCP